MTTTKPFQPMLAYNKPWELKDLRYPIYCTPKLDGIRVCNPGGILQTRNGKDIPNRYIRSILEKLPPNLDGEVVTVDTANKPDKYNTVQSKFSAHDGEPAFIFFIFDYIYSGSYIERITRLNTHAMMELLKLFRHHKLFPVEIRNEEELLRYEQACLNAGDEGLIIRSADGPYKQGRSTFNEGYMLKLCRWEHREAIITGVTELQHNLDTSSTKNENMYGGNTLGALECVDLENEQLVIVGSGFDHATRNKIWNEPEKFIGKTITYKHKIHGKKEKFRTPIFVGFREDK